MRALVWLVAALLTAWPSALRADESVWEALREPGTVVVLRHSYAPGGFDPPGARLDDCSTQRNLDDNGRAQARRLLLEAVKTVADDGTPRGVDPTYASLAAAEAVLPRGTDWRDADLPAGSQIAQTV